MKEVRDCNISEMIEIIKMLNNWHDEIINSFIVVNGKRLSNGIMESRNSIVKLIKKTGNGYVNFARFRNRCMYCMNKNA
ncbi:transposase, partial [Anaerostipes caccae]|nr:transposase [Anaerostipes caccae]